MINKILTFIRLLSVYYDKQYWVRKEINLDGKHKDIKFTRETHTKLTIGKRTRYCGGFFESIVKETFTGKIIIPIQIEINDRKIFLDLKLYDKEDKEEIHSMIFMELTEENDIKEIKIIRG